MKYKKFDLGNYNLYTIVTDRFKTIDLKINIRIEKKKEYDKYIPMLWRMLVSTSSKYDPLKENVLELGSNIKMFKDNYLKTYEILNEYLNNK